MPSSPRKSWRAPEAVKVRARELRRPLTPAERVLWQHLRNNQLDGAHFRRQHPADTFIVDFVCARARLAVEVDGDSHAGQAAYDAQRTARLAASKHYRVVRFTNREVLGNTKAVVEAIRGYLKEGPPLRPAPVRKEREPGRE